MIRICSIVLLITAASTFADSWKYPTGLIDRDVQYVMRPGKLSGEDVDRMTFSIISTAKEPLIIKAQYREKGLFSTDFYLEKIRYSSEYSSLETVPLKRMVVDSGAYLPVVCNVYNKPYDGYFLFSVRTSDVLTYLKRALGSDLENTGVFRLKLPIYTWSKGKLTEHLIFYSEPFILGGTDGNLSYNSDISAVEEFFGSRVNVEEVGESVIARFYEEIQLLARCYEPN